MSAGPLPPIEVGELLARVDRGEDLLLLDVRNEDEFESWRLEGRKAIETIHVPYFDFIEEPEASIGKVPRGRDLVVLCAKGGSSEMVVEMLREAGVAARNVRDGMVGYGDYLQFVRVPPAAGDGDGDGDLEIWQANRRGKGCLSYAVIAVGQAVVVDPARHPAPYESFVAARGARISRVLDTHVHADHVSGGPELASRAGVPYSVAAGAGFQLGRAVAALRDGAELPLAGYAMRVLATPGHTPGSTCYLVGGRYLLTGDTLFVAGIGRPDLGGHVAEWGDDLFHTLRDRLASLPDDVVVLPGHTSGPHEIGSDGVVKGRLGDLRRSVPELQIGSAEAFVDAMKRAVRTAPESYGRIIRINLGVETADAEKLTELELGKNQCAASGH